MGKGGIATTGSNNNGVELRGGSVVASNGTGAITIFGTGGAAPLGDNDGVTLWEAGTTVSSIVGNINITGNGGTSSNSLNTGVFLLSNTTVRSTGTARVNITGTGGLGTDVNMGARIQGNVSSVDGDISLMGTASDATGDFHHGLQINAGQITTTGNANFYASGTSSGPSGIGVRMFNTTLSLTGQQNTISGDTIALETSATINATGKTVTLQPNSPGRLINLGSLADSTQQTLELSDAELDRITSAHLIIGTSTSGAITVGQPISPSGTSTLQLITGGGVSQSGSITVANLAVQAEGNIALGMTSNDVDRFAASSTGGFVSFGDTDGISVGTVAGQQGVSALGGPVSLYGRGDITIENTAAIVDLLGTGTPVFTYAISVFVDSPTAKFTIADGASVQSTGGHNNYRASKMNLSGTIEALGKSVELFAGQNNLAIDLGSTTDTAFNTLELSDAELDRITADVIAIDLQQLAS